MRLKQPENGFRYNTDSILLYQFAASTPLRGRALDVGCGCGVVGLLLARDFGLSLTGVDLQEEMKPLTSQNPSLRLARYRDALPLADLLSQCSSLLDTKGELFFCYEAAAFYETLGTLKTHRYHLKSLRFVHRDQQTPARLVLFQVRKMPVRATTTHPPIFLHEKSAISPQMSQFAKEANTLCVA